MNLPELSRIVIFATGRTEPFVPSGTEVLLIQNGRVEVGKLFYTLNTLENYIEHPENNKKLSQKALNIVKAKNPELLESEDSVILICPMSIKNEMIWKQ